MCDFAVLSSSAKECGQIDSSAERHPASAAAAAAAVTRAAADQLVNIFSLPPKKKIISAKDLLHRGVFINSDPVQTHHRSRKLKDYPML